MTKDDFLFSVETKINFSMKAGLVLTNTLILLKLQK